MLFFSAALAIVPIARADRALDRAARDAHRRRRRRPARTRRSATPELIIALVALGPGSSTWCGASIIGAILANLMLATGVAFLLGGLRYHTQEYNSGAARLYSSMMLISAVSLGVPSAFNRFFSPDSTSTREARQSRHGGGVARRLRAVPRLPAEDAIPTTSPARRPGRTNTATADRSGASGAPSAAWSARRSSRRG
jgi:calcium/proton exchanger cax